MFRLSGTINRLEYWRNLLLVCLVLGGVEIVIFLAFNAILPDEVENATEASILILIIIAIPIFAWAASVFSIFIRRARDAGNAVLWSVIAILFPIGFVLLGLLPTANSNN